MYKGVHILVGVVLEDQGMETKMDILIHNLLVFELERYGLITGKVQFGENDSFELILSSESESGLAVICSYTSNGKRVLLDLEMYDTRTMVILASNSISADLDLSFDTAIYTAVSELLNSADEDLSKRVVNIEYDTKTSDQNENIHEIEAETDLSISNAEIKGGMEAFLNTGIPMGVGDSQGILTEPGFSLDLSAVYWLYTKLGSFGLGGQAAANLHPSANPEGFSSLIMFPLGVSLSWSTPNDRLFSSFVQFGTGPAIAVLTFESADPLVKVVPYVSGGVFLSFNLWKRMSLGLKTVYHIYFEDTGILTTLTPSIYASFRSWN